MLRLRPAREPVDDPERLRVDDRTVSSLLFGTYTSSRSSLTCSANIPSEQAGDNADPP
jgi:hypothetical protein